MALFRGTEAIRADNVMHPVRGGSSARPDAQRDLRVRAVREFLETAGAAPGSLAAIAVHAAAPHPVATGTYRIDAALLREAERHRPDGESLAAVVAHALAEEWRCPAFAVDLASGSEWDALERPADGPCERAIHAMKAAARRHALAVDRPLDALRLVLVHLGAAVSVCVQSGGRVGDVHHALDPRSAATDLDTALARAEEGDGRASAVLHAAANQIAKCVGALATVLEGEVDAVLVTGSLERAGLVVAEICRRVEWIAPVFLYRDQDELLALAQGAHAVLEGDEPLKHYA
jgi:butyrate kinase